MFNGATEEQYSFMVASVLSGKLRVFKNFMRAKYERSNPSDPDANLKTPAMYEGIEKKKLDFYLINYTARNFRKKRPILL